MTAVAAPSTYAQVGAVTGYSYTFAKMAIIAALTERLNALELGLASLRGDVAGTGSLVLRITNYDGIGFAETFQTMASETAAIVPTGFAIDSDDITVARHGISKSMSYVNQAVDAGRPEAMEDIVGEVGVLAGFKEHSQAGGRIFRGDFGDGRRDFGWQFREHR